MSTFQYHWWYELKFSICSSVNEDLEIYIVDKWATYVYILKYVILHKMKCIFSL